MTSDRPIPFRSRWVTGAGFAAAAAGAALLVPAAPAHAATCSSNGVNVVVDFGGSIQTGCAAGDPTSAWAALQTAGFSVEGTQRFPTSFVCRINGFPSPADEACIQTPPATAYWAFWTASTGSGWSYSSTGAASYNPPPGSSLGFAFGAGRSPGMAPPAAPSTPSSTSTTHTSTSHSPTTHSTTTGQPSSQSPGATGSATTGAGPTSTGTGTAPASPSAASSSTTSSSTPSGPASTASATDTVVANPAGGTSNSSAATGSGPKPALVIGGGAAVALVLVAGAVIVRRQRDRALRE